VTGPLDGIRILDLTRLLPGNHATLLLADLGADVIKVEEPGRGDYIRWMPPLVDGEGAIHRAVNRGKRSVTLNLKAPEGVAAMRRLVRGADALVESFRPGVMARLGVGYETLAGENPRLVYCAITGYGQDGPERDRVGHDLNYIGRVGMLAAAGPPGGPPSLPPVQIADLGAGMAAALGTVAALGEASRTGRGRFVDVAMLDVAAAWMAVAWGWFLGTGQALPPGRLPLTGGLACYRLYRAADGGYLAVGALEPRFWENLCRALDLPELIDLHLVPEEQEAVAARLQEVFAARTRDEWIEALGGVEACVSPVLDVPEAITDPQLLHRGLVAEVDGTPIGPGPALKVDGHAPATLPAPGLGEHTEEVLAEAGYGTDEVASLRAAGTV
jgi:alpha-methylacyl-CoA racemase